MKASESKCQEAIRSFIHSVIHSSKMQIMRCSRCVSHRLCDVFLTWNLLFVTKYRFFFEKLFVRTCKTSSVSFQLTVAHLARLKKNKRGMQENKRAPCWNREKKPELRTQSIKSRGNVPGALLCCVCYFCRVFFLVLQSFGFFHPKPLNSSEIPSETPMKGTPLFFSKKQKNYTSYLTLICGTRFTLVHHYDGPPRPPLRII